MRRRKKPEGGTFELGQLLEGALKQLGVKGDYDRFRVEQKCRAALGEKAARALTRVDLRKRTVHLEFNHSIWLQEMNYRKGEVLKMLQRDLPELGIQGLSLGLSRGGRI
ncbi:MAG TPA: DciA family protein [bacterium]|nr:DciA family protein [bacterium]